ncbi:hypothetical protein [Nocardioides sp. SR21]|uniref:hypothetical protein n=1 Tax=Nocardioides sp. SR21 TaxID=2919501 RepID=UPI001FAAEA7A|nr:hypothetical protein [Nocardioides sp. SR21]
MALLGWAVAIVATRPSARDDDRRFRRVFRNPELVNLLDVEKLLRADGVPADAVERAMRRAERHRISARTMWRWIDAHGAARLVTVLDAGLSEDSLLDHLDAGTTPEWTSISVFADLANVELPAGMPLDELVDLDAVPAFEDLMFDGLDDWTTQPDEELAGFDALPPIADPGFGPFSADEALREAARTRAEDAETAPDERAEPKKPEGGGDWPAVA